MLHAGPLIPSVLMPQLSADGEASKCTHFNNHTKPCGHVSVGTRVWPAFHTLNWDDMRAASASTATSGAAPQIAHALTMKRNEECDQPPTPSLQAPHLG